MIGGQAWFLEGKDAIQTRQLLGAVEAEAGLWIDPRGPQSPDLIVVAEQPAGNARNNPKLTDSEHSFTL